MKKLLTILTLLVAVVSQGFATENEIWTGSEAISWNEGITGTQYELASSNFSGITLKKGNTIKVYSEVTSGFSDPQYVMTYKAGSSWSWTNLSTTVSTTGVICYTVESDKIASEISQRGLIFRGQAYTITRVVVDDFTPSDGEEILDATETIIGNWSGSITIPNAKINDAVAGDIIKVYVKDVANDAQWKIAVATGNWDAISTDTNCKSFESNTISYTLTSTDLTTIGTEPIGIQGKNYTIVCVTLTRSNPKYKVLITAENGSIKRIDSNLEIGYDATTKYEKNSTATFKAYANDGYNFVKWTDNSDNQLSTESTYTTAALTSDLELIAIFEKQKFSVSVNSSSEAAGTAAITSSTPVAVSEGIYEYGSTITVQASANEGYRFVNWTDGNSSEVSTEASFTTEAITGEFTLTANFIQQFTVTATSEDTDKGTVSFLTGSSGDSFDYGSSVTITATPKEGTDYEFDKWTKTGDDTWNASDAASNNPLTITNLDGNWALTASFKEATTSASTIWEGSTSLDWGANPGVNVSLSKDLFSSAVVGSVIKIEGTTSSEPQIKLSINYPWKDCDQVTALPLQYTIASAADIESIKSNGMQIQGQNAVITKVTLDNSNPATLYTYTLTVTDVNETQGTVTVTGKTSDNKYESGATIKVVAEAKEGYRFVNWTNGSNVVVSTDAEYTITITDGGSLTLTANFIQQFTVTATSEDTSKGTVAITNADASNKYDAGSNVTVTASPLEGFIFDKWTKDGDTEWSSTSNPQTIENLAADWTLTASFKDAKILDWSHEYEVSKDLFSSVETGGKVKINFTFTNGESNGSLQIVHRTAEGGGWNYIPEATTGTPTPSNTVTASPFTIDVTETLATNLKAYGLILKGDNVTFSSVELEAAPVTNHTVNISSVSGGTISIKNGETPVKSGDEIEANTVLTLTAEPDATHYFSNWIIGDDASITTNPYEYTVTGDVTIGATFSDLLTPTIQLSSFEAGDGATLSDGVFTTTADGKTISQSIGDNSGVKGSKLVVKFAGVPTGGEGQSIKVAAEYVASTYTEVYAYADANNVAVVDLDNTKNIKKIYIQLTKAGSVTVNSVALDPVYTLTKSATTNGSFTVSTDGGKNTTDETSFAHGTTLTFTATADPNYVFSKWSDEAIENPHNVVITDNLTMGATFDSETTSTPKIDDEGKVDLSQFTAQGDAQYNSSTATLTASAQWQAIQLWLNDSETKSGSELVVKFVEDALAEVVVTYTDNTNNQVDMSATGMEAKVSLDNTKQIRKIEIKNAAEVASNSTVTIQLSEVTLNQTASETRTEKTLVTANVVCGSSVEGETETIPGYKFENAVVGDEIVVHVSAVAESGACIIPKYPTGSYPSLLGNAYSASVSSTDTEYRLALTSDMITSLKSSGLQVYGKNLTIGVIALYTESELGTDDPVTNYTLTTDVTPTGSGSIQVQTVVGEVATNTDETSFASGTNLKLTATPATGYDFSGWTIGDNSQSDNPYTFSINSDITATATFTAIKAFTLDGFDAGAGNTYDATTHVLTTASDWSGMQLWIGDNSTYSGNKLVLRTLDSSQLKITVGYTDGSTSELEEGAAVMVRAIALESSKKIQKVIIQNQEAGTVTFTEFALDPSYTLTITAPENGSFTVKSGETELSTGASVAYGTSLTLTPTANDGYSFTKWTINDTDITDNPYIFTQTEATTVSATFTADAVVTPAFTDGKADLSKFEVQDAGKVTYDAETHTITVTEGWTGVQITATSADDVQGKELRITFSEAAKVKATVKYADETATDTIMSDAATILYMVINGTKKVSQIQIQPTEAGSITLNEVKVNAESTKPADPVITPVFTDGVADLSKFEVQDADKVTYDTESHRITVTEGWTGVQVSVTTADDVQGKELRITFSDAAKVKATVKYADETATDTIMSDAATILYMVINGTKKVSQIQIQPTEAGSVTLNEVKVNAESTKPADPVITPVFTDGVADLSKFEVQDADKVTYDAESHKITVTEGWTGVQVSVTTADDVQGKEVRITFSEAAKVKAAVKYADETATDTIMSEAATILYMVINGTKKVSQIQIQPIDVGSVTLSEVKVNAESTKPADPVIAPVFTDGVADLSKFEVQDAEKVTYDAETHTITVTEGWTGVQVTATSADDVQGKEVRITFSEAAKVKAAVKYADETATDTIMSEAATILYMVINGTKKVSQIQIQPIDVGSVTLSEVKVNAESTKPADPVIAPVFTDGVADLSKFEVQDAEKVTYDAETHTITVTEGWTGVQVTATSADDVQGKEVRITFSEAAKVKAAVKYADETATDTIMSEAATILYMVINGTKKVSQIQIQPIDVGSVTLSEVKVNAESTKPAEPEPTPGQTGVNISLAELNEGWNSTYDATSKTITTTDDWGARGWYVGDDRYNDKGSITVKFNAVEHAVTLKMEYTNANDEAKDVSVGAAAGETEITLDIPANIKTINKVYITYEPAGTLTLTEATVNDKVIDNRTEKTLVEKSQAIADGDILINRGLFSNAVAGDVVRIYGGGLGETSKIALEPADFSGALDGANWVAFTESPFVLKLTAAALSVIQEKGLLIRGEKYTFTKAVLYTEKELGKEIIDVQKYTLTLSTPENGTVVIKKGNEEVKAGEFDENTELTLTATAAEGYEFTKWQKNGEAAGTEATLTVKMTADMTIAAVFSKKTEPIIDEETGETDLTEMTPQDPSTTSVEYNDEDQSITITTTEPYKAAQIWFNEPEKLAKGNVLIVDIAESGVNVTVTVKYTDGTESSMTSTAHAASSRHAAVAGTKISVPLETGKDVQNIEVKNAEAGTITIQKMVVTTKNIFTDGVADLSMAKPQSNAIYDTSTYSLAVTKGWTGITITPLANEQVSGVELMLQFTSAAQVKVAVTYNEGEGPSVIMDEAAKYLQITLDKTKTVKEIQIQPTAAGVVQFKSLAVNQTVSPAPDYVAPLEEGERRTLFESMEGTQLSWNDICQMAANYGAILEEREQIEVYISARTEDCEWPKVFIKDANGEECGTVAELSAVDLFPYMAKFKLTNEMVEQLRDGFSICGDGIIVTQVCLYKPAALKAGDIDVADLNGGYQSSYDATSKTITTTSRWAARGWDIGDNRYNNYDVVVVQFEAVEFPVTLRMEYVDMNGETKTLSQGASAGNTQVEIEIPDDIQQINYVYLMYENPGTLILTNAEALRSTYRTKTLNLADFEAISDGTTYDNKTFTMTSTADNGTIQLWLNSPIEGGEDLTLTLVNDAAKVSMLVGYTDGSQVSVESEGTTALLPLNHSKNIQKIMISIQTAGTVQFESIQMTQRILTFIPSVKTDIHYQQNDDSWYRLDGKRVSQPGRGIYIHNGKKIVIK